jgi:hypothetical protein
MRTKLAGFARTSGLVETGYVLPRDRVCADPGGRLSYTDKPKARSEWFGSGSLRVCDGKHAATT